MHPLPRIAIATLLLLAGAGTALHADDVGLVTKVTGQVTLQAGGATAPARFMGKVPDGAVLTVAAGGAVQVVFFAPARSETWSGPARFACGANGGRSLAGNPGARLVVRAVPGAARYRTVSRSFSDLGTRRIGAVLQRGNKNAPEPGIPPEKRAICAHARAEYEAALRDAPADDVTAELRYLAVLIYCRQYAEIRLEAIRVVKVALVKQPGNADLAQALADLEWLQAHPLGKGD